MLKVSVLHCCDVLHPHVSKLSSLTKPLIVQKLRWVCLFMSVNAFIEFTFSYVVDGT